MSDVLEDAVRQMLAAFGSQVRDERVHAFCVALHDERLCPRCGARAARRLIVHAKRPPVPADLIRETNEEMDSSGHVAHLADRQTIGDSPAWWVTEAPVIVRRCWPELDTSTAIEVAKVLGGMEYVLTTPDAIGAELGFVDEHGPTLERQWWYELSGLKLPPPNMKAGLDTYERSVPEGDR